MTTTLYLIEFYQLGPKGETGWDIQFAWVRAIDRKDAQRRLRIHPHARFDEVITCNQMAKISPLAMKKAPLFINNP